MNISVMGCGRWGSFIAWYLERVSHQVTLYGRKGSKHLEQFRQTRSNGLLTLDEKVHLTDGISSKQCGSHCGIYFGTKLPYIYERNGTV